MNRATTNTHIMSWSGERSWKTYPYTTLSISISTSYPFFIWKHTFMWTHIHIFCKYVSRGLSELWNERNGLHSCYELMLAFSEMRYGKILWNISNTNIFSCDFPPQSIFPIATLPTEQRVVSFQTKKIALHVSDSFTRINHLLKSSSKQRYLLAWKMGIHTGKGWMNVAIVRLITYDNVMVVYIWFDRLSRTTSENQSCRCINIGSRQRISFAASKQEMNEMIPNPNARMTFPRKWNEADAFDYDNGWMGK